MHIKELAIRPAWVLTPRQHIDERGAFLETFQAATLEEIVGHRLSVAQVNCSVSKKGTLRGIHFADVPPSQAKYVTCLHGAVIDVVVDIRVGSPTFGGWDSVRLDDQDKRSLYVAEGLGHAFMAITDDATVSYICSEPFAPGREHGINPLDPAIGIDWPTGIEPLLSSKDEAAPTLEEAQLSGLLPPYADCESFYAELRNRGRA